MNDQELADKVVALGVGKHYPETASMYEAWVVKANDDPDLQGMDADQFVRSWEVAGALMEKCPDAELIWFELDDGAPDTPRWCICDGLANDISSDKSLPRAIIEACVEALTNE